MKVIVSDPHPGAINFIRKGLELPSWVEVLFSDTPEVDEETFLVGFEEGLSPFQDATFDFRELRTSQEARKNLKNAWKHFQARYALSLIQNASEQLPTALVALKKLQTAGLIAPQDLVFKSGVTWGELYALLAIIATINTKEFLFNGEVLFKEQKHPTTHVDV